MPDGSPITCADISNGKTSLGQSTMVGGQLVTVGELSNTKESIHEELVIDLLEA